MTETFASAGKPKTSLELVSCITEAIHEAKGQNLSVINVSKLCDLSEYFVIVSGRSDRQVQGISNRVIEAVKKFGGDVLSLEGIDQGQWVLIDLGEIVIHVFYEATREYYDFDSLWARGEHLKLTDGADSNRPDNKGRSRHAA